MEWNSSIKVLTMKKVTPFIARGFSAWMIFGIVSIGISLLGI